MCYCSKKMEQKKGKYIVILEIFSEEFSELKSKIEEDHRDLTK